MKKWMALAIGMVIFSTSLWVIFGNEDNNKALNVKPSGVMASEHTNAQDRWEVSEQTEIVLKQIDEIMQEQIIRQDGESFMYGNISLEENEKVEQILALLSEAYQVQNLSQRVEDMRRRMYDEKNVMTEIPLHDTSKETIRMLVQRGIIPTGTPELYLEIIPTYKDHLDQEVLELWMKFPFVAFDDVNHQKVYDEGIQEGYWLEEVYSGDELEKIVFQDAWGDINSPMYEEIIPSLLEEDAFRGSEINVDVVIREEEMVSTSLYVKSYLESGKAFEVSKHNENMFKQVLSAWGMPEQTIKEVWDQMIVSIDEMKDASYEVEGYSVDAYMTPQKYYDGFKLMAMKITVTKTE